MFLQSADARQEWHGCVDSVQISQCSFLRTSARLDGALVKSRVPFSVFCDSKIVRLLLPREAATHSFPANSKADLKTSTSFLLQPPSSFNPQASSLTAHNLPSPIFNPQHATTFCVATTAAMATPSYEEDAGWDANQEQCMRWMNSLINCHNSFADPKCDFVSFRAAVNDIVQSEFDKQKSETLPCTLSQLFTTYIDAVGTPSSPVSQPSSLKRSRTHQVSSY